MAVIRGQSYVVDFVAWDMTNNQPKTGDAANITVRISKDGGALTATTNNPQEVDATNAPGLYRVTLTASEMDANTILVVPKSSTSGVFCQSVTVLTERGSFSAVPAGVWGASNRTLTGFGTLVSDIWSHSSRTLTSFGSLVSDIWSHSTRTLTSFGTLVSDVASAVWSHTTRTLTSFGTLVSDIAAAVWSHTTRTLTGFGTLASDIASAVWGHTTRTLTSLGDASGQIAQAVWQYSTRTLTSLGDAATQTAAAVWSYTIEASQSAVAWLRLMGAALFNNRTRTGETYIHRDWADTKNRIVGSVDANGNRTVTTRDGS